MCTTSSCPAGVSVGLLIKRWCSLNYWREKLHNTTLTEKPASIKQLKQNKSDGNNQENISPHVSILDGFVVGSRGVSVMQDGGVIPTDGNVYVNMQPKKLSHRDKCINSTVKLCNASMFNSGHINTEPPFGFVFSDMKLHKLWQNLKCRLLLTEYLVV